jgi:hypothetical protein
VTKTQFAWLVGFYEGEGSCWIAKNHTHGYTYERVAIDIGQKDRTPLDYIHKRLKFGSIFRSKAGFHSWRTVGPKAIRLLRLMLPHMKSQYKIQQVRRVLNAA